jgi:hypothetical protein
MAPAGSAEENLTTVWSDVLEYYLDNPNPNRFTTILLSMFTDAQQPCESFPKLKGKAAEVKALVPAVLFVWRKYMRRENDIHRFVELGLQMSAKIDQIIDETRRLFALQGEDLQRYRTAVFSFLVMQNVLAGYYNNHGLKLFNITIKSHYLAHSAVQAAWLHPVKGWCFTGEDLMQKLKNVANYSVHGIKPGNLGVTLLEKYCTGMFFELSPASQWYCG